VPTVLMIALAASAILAIAAATIAAIRLGDRRWARRVRAEWHSR
jgi:hypothetical protein